MNNCKYGWSSELKVAADLTDRGYDVYLGFSGKYDLIAMKSDIFYRVEVKTSKHMKMDWHRFTNTPDIVALVSPKGVIQYRAFRSKDLILK
jgi:Holliday junction resolvase